MSDSFTIVSPYAKRPGSLLVTYSQGRHNEYYAQITLLGQNWDTRWSVVLLITSTVGEVRTPPPRNLTEASNSRQHLQKCHTANPSPSSAQVTLLERCMFQVTTSHVLSTAEITSNLQPERSESVHRSTSTGERPATSSTTRLRQQVCYYFPA